MVNISTKFRDVRECIRVLLNQFFSSILYCNIILINIILMKLREKYLCFEKDDFVSVVLLSRYYKKIA